MYLSTDELKILFSGTPKCIDPYREARVQNASYELSLGDQVYQTNSKSGKKDKLDDSGNSQVIIEPGQFALLLTEETLDVPLDKIAFISIKFREKKKGLVNISGFHVDPGFKGKIKFSVYNAGPSTIVLDKGQRCFVIWFAQLTSKAEEYKGDHQGQMDLNAKDIEPLKGELASPNVLLEKIKRNSVGIKSNWWVLSIIISLFIAMNIKVWTDNNKFKDGYEIGIREKATKEQVNQEIIKANIDSIVSAKVDSVLNTKKID